ncbi:MAG TPA: SRPBCC family protein [Noviherbaspirillum sp.]|nr:SRPBCC family protein [Noviherbaspirillum sp.]
MKQQYQKSARGQSLMGLISAAALGAVAMYMSDPDRGRRRRALATDKVRSLATKTSDAIDVATRDLGNRAQGMRAQATRTFSRHATDTDNDELTVARVRKEIGRVVAHPRAIKVTAQQGYVSLRGSVLAHEKQQLLDRVKSVPGISEVDDKLEEHESPVGIPSLQGEGRLRRASSSIMQETWSPALRAIAAIGGGALGLYGLTRRTPASVAAATLGVGLITRSVLNRPFNRLASQGAGQRVIDLQKSIYIQASPETVFDEWSRYENFPHFMSNVQDVRDLGNGRSHWIVSGPAGTRIEWDASMTESVRPQRLAWNSEPNATVQHSGTVHFEPSGDGTRVTVQMLYSPPAGKLGHAFASLFNGNPKRQMEEDLMRMKSYIESGIPPHDAAQPMMQAQSSSQQPQGTTLH